MAWEVTSAAGIRAESELMRIFNRCGYRSCARPDPGIKENAIALSSPEEDQNKIDLWICVPITPPHFRWIPVQVTVSRRAEYVREKKQEAMDRGIVFWRLDLQNVKTAVSDRKAGATLIASLVEDIKKSYKPQ